MTSGSHSSLSSSCSTSQPLCGSSWLLPQSSPTSMPTELQLSTGLPLTAGASISPCWAQGPRRHSPRAEFLHNVPHTGITWVSSASSAAVCPPLCPFSLPQAENTQDTGLFISTRGHDTLLSAVSKGSQSPWGISTLGPTHELICSPNCRLSSHCTCSFHTPDSGRVLLGHQPLPSSAHDCSLTIAAQGLLSLCPPLLTQTGQRLWMESLKSGNLMKP